MPEGLVPRPPERIGGDSSFFPEIRKPIEQKTLRKSARVVSHALSFLPAFKRGERKLKQGMDSIIPGVSKISSTVSKLSNRELENRRSSNVYSREVLGKIPEMHCSAGIYSDINGSIEPEHRFSLKKGVSNIVYDIRELTEYVEGKIGDPDWVGGDWQRPSVELSGDDVSRLQKEYNRRMGGDKVNFAPLMSRLSGMSLSDSEKVELGEVLAKLKGLMKFPTGTRVGEKAFRVQEAFDYVDTLSSTMKAAVLNLRDSQTGKPMRAIKTMVDIAKNSPASGSDICKKDLVDPMVRIIKRYADRYKPSEPALESFLEEEGEEDF